MEWSRWRDTPIQTWCLFKNKDMNMIPGFLDIRQSRRVCVWCVYKEWLEFDSHILNLQSSYSKNLDGSQGVKSKVFQTSLDNKCLPKNCCSPKTGVNMSSPCHMWLICWGVGSNWDVHTSQTYFSALEEPISLEIMVCNKMHRPNNKIRNISHQH